MTDIKAQIAQSGMLKGSANSQHEIVASKVEVNTAGINLGDLTDVTITSPTDGSYVVYQSSSNTFLDDQTITKTATGINLTGNLDLPDDGKLLFGDDDDLQIYHDGTHSYIIDDGVGDLIIRGSDDIKLQTSAGERGIIINTDTSVELYYNNGLKLSTTAGGVDVIGTLEADAITVNGITLAETISDTVGAMVGSNTESGIAVTYDDLDNTLDFNVDDFNIALTGDVTGTGTVTNLGNVSFETTIPNSSIVNNQLANSSITVSDGTNSTATALGGTITFAAGSGLDVAESSGTITFAAEDAGFFNKGIASFSSSDFGISSGFVTIKSGGVTNTQLANNTVSYGGVTLALGATDGTPAFNLSDATNYPTSSLTGTITNAQLAGSIANNKLTNSSITVSDGTNTSPVALGGTLTFAGTTNEVAVTENAGTVTVGLPDDVTIAGDLSVSTAPTSGAHVTNKTYVDAQVANVVDSAPAALDTLNELAAALGDDANFATTTATSIGTKLPLAGGTMTGNITFNSTQAFDGRDVSADGSKLDLIEAAADVTDATNVTAAGALMDSEVTNLAQVKAFDETDYATAAQGAKADSALQTAPVTSVDGNTGAVTTLQLGTSSTTALAGDTVVDNHIISVPSTGGGNVTGDKKYIRICTVSIPTRYNFYSTTLGAVGSSSGTGFVYDQILSFRVKQQNAFGSNPAIEVSTYYNTNTDYDFGYVITSNGTAGSGNGTGPTTVELWARIDGPNSGAEIHKIADAGVDSSVTATYTIGSYQTSAPANFVQGGIFQQWHSGNQAGIFGSTNGLLKANGSGVISAAVAGTDYSTLALGTSSTTALAGNTALLQLGTSSTTALAGDTALLQLGTSSSTALAGNTLAGDVGIGESSPARRLHVTAAAGVDYVARFQSDDVASGIELVDSVSTCAIRTSSGHLIMSADTGAGNDNTSIRFNLDHLTASANEGMRLDTTGLGIGTLTPSAKLDVNGNAKITGNLALVGSGYAANLTTNFGPDNTGSSSSWIRTGVELGVNAQEGQPNGIWVGNNGNNLYVTGAASDDVHEYDLSTPYKIATASLTNSAVFGNTYGNNVQSMWMNNGSSSFTITEDGTEVTYATGQYLLMVDGGSDQLRQFRLSTAWDMSTRSSSIIVTRDLSVADVNPTGVAFNSDGTKIIIVGSGGTGGDGDIIYSYNLSNPYDIRGIAVSSGSQAVAPDAKVLFSTFQETQGVTGTGVRDPITLVQDIAFTPDGKTVHIACKDRDGLVTFRLGTAFDITTMTYAGALDLSYIESNVSALYYDPVNNLALMSGQSNDTLYEFTTNNNALVTDAKSTRFQGKITVDDDSLIEGNLLVAGKLLVRASVIGVGVTMTGNIAFTGNGGITTKIGGTTATGNIDIGRSSKSQTMNLSSFSDTESGQAKVVNIATKGLSSSVRTVNIASDSITGVTTTVNMGNPNNAAVSTILMSGSLEVNPGSVGRTTIIGGTEQTGAMTFGRSTASQTINIGTGITASGATKTINIGTAGASSSTTAINIGNTSSSTSTLSLIARDIQIPEGIVTFKSDGANVATYDQIAEFQAKVGTDTFNIAGKMALFGVSSAPSRFVLGFGNAGMTFFDGFGSKYVQPANADTGLTTDDVCHFGSASTRWDIGYFAGGTTTTSDGTEKQDIEELTDAEERVAIAAKGLLRKYRWKRAVGEKGDNARIHFGIIAQDLKSAFIAEGLDAHRYGMFMSDTWYDIGDGVAYPSLDDIPEDQRAGATEKTRLGIRYEQLLAFIISAL